MDWVRSDIARSPDPQSFTSHRTSELEVADLDNNGGLDLVVMSLLPYEAGFQCTDPPRSFG